MIQAMGVHAMRRRLALIVAAALAATFAWTPPAAHADPTGTIQLNASGSSQLPAQVGISSWSGNSLVYSLQSKTAHDNANLPTRRMVVTVPGAPVEVADAQWVAGTLITAAVDHRL